MTLLDVQNLRAHFATPGGVNRAVEGVSFHLEKGQVLAVVGESGSGKSVTANSILGLLPQPPAKTSGTILFNGTDLLKLSQKEMRDIRGHRIGMIFQDPMASLNPLLRIGYQVTEPIRLHENLPRELAKARALEMLRLVGLSDPERRMLQYPHQLSGGMRQRVMIAMALVGKPELLIADEPTTALDVTIQAQILDILRDAQRKLGLAIILITHDLGVVAETADRVVVMYAGRKVEDTSATALFANPMHPYTRALLKTIPVPGTSSRGQAGRLEEIPGMVPDLRQPVIGCVFRARCPISTELCSKVAPALEAKAVDHVVACHHAAKEEGMA